jgi:hypothetical protein
VSGKDYLALLENFPENTKTNIRFNSSLIQLLFSLTVKVGSCCGPSIFRFSTQLLLWGSCCVLSCFLSSSLLCRAYICTAAAAVILAALSPFHTYEAMIFLMLLFSPAIVR